MAEVAISRLSQLVGADGLAMACASPEQIRSTYGIRGVAWYNSDDAAFWGAAFRRPLSFLKAIVTLISEVARADVVFVCGGGNMTSVWPGVLESRLRLLRVANALGRKVILVSQTLGPYSEQHRPRVNAVLRHAGWVGVRDRTYSNTQVSVPVRFAVDDACFLEARHSAASQRIADHSGRFACLSMRKFAGATDEQLRALADAVSALATADSANVVFIPHHAPGGTGHDIRLAEAVAEAFPTGMLRIVNPILLASELKAITRDSQWVVTMRYHQLVFALSLGLPVVGVSVDEYTRAKLRGAFEQFNLEPEVIDLGDAPAALPAAVQRVTGQRAQFAAAAQELRTREEAASLAPYKLAAEFANGRSRSV